ncbi:MAG: PKD domain-containing protein [Bacteroidales bacterium]|nr:PKD domain-containing protein [Bacteroidales bacterium]
MKKILTLCLAALLNLPFIGCSKDSDDDPGDTSVTPTPIEPAKAVYPTASFTASTNDLTVSVTSHSTNARFLRWNWGDGYSNAQYTGGNASHTYSSAGTYTITLYAESSTGHSDQISHSVTVTNPTPTQVKITSLTLNKFPAAPSSGSWDLAGKPDIYFTIKDGNGTITYFTSTTKLNVNNNNCPMTWYCNYTLYNVTAKYCIDFWDEDDLASDEWMCGAYWTPSTQSNNYSSSFNWKNSSIDLDFTIYMTWYTTKGTALYTKTADFRDGEWQTDDAEVKQALGL